MTNMATCYCVRTHRPKLVVTHWHHIIPQGWGGKTVSGNLIEVCPSTHYTTHALLNEYVRVNGVPPASILRRYPPYARRLAQWGVDGVGGPGKIPHVFTVAHSMEPSKE
jgi:hypothetical protein